MVVSRFFFSACKKLLHAHERERESGEREEKIAREGRIAKERDMREIERESVERIGERGNNPLSLMMQL